MRTSFATAATTTSCRVEYLFGALRRCCCRFLFFACCAFFLLVAFFVRAPNGESALRARKKQHVSLPNKSLFRTILLSMNVMPTPAIQAVLYVDNVPISTVTQYKYLGHIISADNQDDAVMVNLNIKKARSEVSWFGMYSQDSR